MVCIAEMASFSTLAWRPCAHMRMHSNTVRLKLDEEQVSDKALCVQ